ncbi:hypothetical protein, partial [Treponema sp. R8-4-B8]
IRGIFAAIDEINRGIFVWNKHNIDLVIIIIGVPTLFSVLNTKIIFNDEGITVKAKIYLLFFAIHNVPTFMAWDKILHVSYENSMRRGQPFIFRTTNATTRVLFWSPNYRESLIFAINKLPKHKFTMSAQEKLKEMGIWTEDSFQPEARV